jgi:hypothetical protein
MVMLITTAEAGQPLPCERGLTATAARPAFRWPRAAAADLPLAVGRLDELLSADAPGGGLEAEGLGDELDTDGPGRDPAGDVPAGGGSACEVWPVMDAVVAGGRVELAPPTAQASSPSTARPAASAKSLRRQ